MGLEQRDEQRAGEPYDVQVVAVDRLDETAAEALDRVGAALVERIEGDYLNVVGLPATLLVRLLSERFPGAYGFG